MSKKLIECKVVMFGLGGAGRTSMLYKAKYGENFKTWPTIAYNVEFIQYGHIGFEVWDMGGGNSGTHGEELRTLVCNHYTKGNDINIFVIDSNDRVCISLASRWFRVVLKKTTGPIMVIANKQDIPNSLSVKYISDYLSLWRIKNRECCIKPLSTLTGVGSEDIAKWMFNSIAHKYKPECLKNRILDFIKDKPEIAKSYGDKFTYLFMYKLTPHTYNKPPLPTYIGFPDVE